MELEELKAKYYVRLFEKEEYLREFCSGYLYMNNVKNFSKYDDDLINDITEGRVCNAADGATLTWGGLPAGHNISILIPNCYVYCLFELFEGDYNYKNNVIDITSKKFGKFVSSYIGDSEKCFIAIIDADKLNTAISNYLNNTFHYYF